jgi:GAF domain-containing protein
MIRDELPGLKEGKEMDSYPSEEAVRRLQKELDAFRAASHKILTQRPFAETARAIFDFCRAITGACSGYVALLSEDGSENEVLFLEAGNLPCSVNPDLPMPIRGLREMAYINNRVVYDNDFMNSKWVGFLPGGHVPMRNVMFAPLVIEERTVGIIGLANKDGDFSEEDARSAAMLGELAALALVSSRNIDLRNQAEAEKEKLIQNLTESLATVKQLSGLLPICAWCKKIRDDQGYWTQLEGYIKTHSEAEFSHSICPECMSKNFE